MVIVQAGHQHTQENCYSDLRGQTGAPGEIDWTPGIVAAICAKLMDWGVTAQAVDANFNCDPNHVKDFDAFLAVHYQSDPPNESGYFCGPMDPAQDGVAAKSAALAAAVGTAYAAATGLTARPNWDSINIEHYYLFEVLSSHTPVALIECGTGAPNAPDHVFLWSQQAKVVDGIARGIMAYLGKAIPVPAPAPAPVPTPQPTPAPAPIPVTFTAESAGQLIAGPDVDLDKILAAADAWQLANIGAGCVIKDSNGQLIRILAPIAAPAPPPPPVAPEQLPQQIIDQVEQIAADVKGALELLNQLQPLVQLVGQLGGIAPVLVKLEQLLGIK